MTIYGMLLTVVIFAELFATSSAMSLPGISEWLGIHSTTILTLLGNWSSAALIH